MALLHFRLSSLLCIKSVTHNNYFLRLEHLTDIKFNIYDTVITINDYEGDGN